MDIERYNTQVEIHNKAIDSYREQLIGERTKEGEYKRYGLSDKIALQTIPAIERTLTEITWSYDEYVHGGQKGIPRNEDGSALSLRNWLSYGWNGNLSKIAGKPYTKPESVLMVNISNTLRDIISEGIYDSIEEGYREAGNLAFAVGIPKDVLTERLRKVDALNTANIRRTIINWHLSKRFPFKSPVAKEMYEFNAEFGEPGEVTAISPVANFQKILPNVYTDYPYGEFSGSPTLSMRLSRIAESAKESVLDSISKSAHRVPSRAMQLPPSFNRLGESTREELLSRRMMSIKDVWMEETLQRFIKQSIPEMSRIVIAERLRARQMAMLYFYRNLGIKWFKWVPSRQHHERLQMYQLERDWCDDLAETPIQISIGDPREIQRIVQALNSQDYSVFDRVSYYPNARGVVSRKVLHNPLMGIYSCKQVTQKVVTVLAHKWNKRDKKQVFTGRVKKLLFIPPHPYCSCIMVPIYNYDAPPDESLRSDLRIFDILKQVIGEQSAENLTTKVINMMETTPNITYGMLMDVLLEYLSPEIAEKIANPLQTYGPEVFTMSPEDIGLVLAA